MNAPARSFEAKPAVRARRQPRITSACANCGAAFSHKASKQRQCCSIACHADIRRMRLKPDPRPCQSCGAMFAPSRAHGDAKYCSHSCVWKATRGPEFNRYAARKGREKNGATQRGRGAGRTYRKFLGRHEHRVVAERKLGRPLVAGEVVHHIDGDILNNDPANLAVMTQAEHMREHGIGIPGVTPWWEPWKRRWK